MCAFVYEKKICSREVKWKRKKTIYFQHKFFSLLASVLFIQFFCCFPFFFSPPPCCFLLVVVLLNWNCDVFLMSLCICYELIVYDTHTHIHILRDALSTSKSKFKSEMHYRSDWKQNKWANIFLNAIEIQKQWQFSGCTIKKNNRMNKKSTKTHDIQFVCLDCWLES